MQGLDVWIVGRLCNPERNRDDVSIICRGYRLLPAWTSTDPIACENEAGFRSVESVGIEAFQSLPSLDDPGYPGRSSRSMGSLMSTEIGIGPYQNHATVRHSLGPFGSCSISLHNLPTLKVPRKTTKSILLLSYPGNSPRSLSAIGSPDSWWRAASEAPLAIGRSILSAQKPTMFWNFFLGFNNYNPKGFYISPKACRNRSRGPP